MKIVQRLKRLNRKKFLINPVFQLKFILFTTFVGLFAVLIMYLTVYSFFWEWARLGAKLGLPAGSVFYQYIEDQKQVMNRIAAVTSAVLFVAVFILGLLYSHRIAGPIHRLEKHFREIASGKELSKIKFRGMDYFPEVAEAFNDLCKKIQSSHKK